MPRNRPHYRITLGDAIAAHENAINSFGGRHGIQDLTLIESAIGRPYTGYYRTIPKKTAALIESVATNHGFVDGNKRTALTLCHLFLERSGCGIHQTSTVDDIDDVEHLILDLTTKFLSYDEVLMWLNKRIYRVK